MQFEKIREERGIPKIPVTDAQDWQRIRGEYCRFFAENVYGLPLPAPTSLTFEVGDPDGDRFCAGLGITFPVTATGVLLGTQVSFPFRVCLPKSDKPVPFFVLSNFHKPLSNPYLPIEEIVDRGFGVIYTYYKDVTSDDGDFTNGISRAIYPDGGEHRAPNAPGKIQMWAWANSRMLDFALSDPRFDPTRAAVIGHSRLGKTALVTGMQDERFAFVISNNAGCSGDAVTKGKEGEHIEDITRVFPYWFCESYRQKYVALDRDEGVMDFDQHMLLATIAPRILMVGSAENDRWADPVSQKLCCHLASVAWENLGKTGFVAPDAPPTPWENDSEGSICYHHRAGDHYLSRLDWVAYMDAMASHSGVNEICTSCK